MPVINDDIFRERIKMALLDYQNKKISEGKQISAQRQKDLQIIYHYVETFMDTTQLELQIVDYIRKMPHVYSWRAWFFLANEQSVLRTMLENILWDENCQRMRARYCFFTESVNDVPVRGNETSPQTAKNSQIGPWQSLVEYPLLTQGER